MTHVAAFTILALTVSLALSRPRIGTFRIHHSTAAVIGAALAILSGVVPIDLLFVALRILALPIVTIVSLMVITLIADHAGVFALIARRIAIRAGGDGRRLFTLIFFSGTVTGMVFTNDAAVLIFTPLVFNLVEQVQQDSWRPSHKIPYYFAVLYVANLVGALVISNPINIVVSSIFGITFIEYAKWMLLPSLVSVFVTYAGLRFFFGSALPRRYDTDKLKATPHDPTFVRVCAIILSLTLLGFFTESFTHIPIWAVASLGALTLLWIAHSKHHLSYAPIIRGIGWDVIVFVIGIFIVAMGLRNAGVTHDIAALIHYMAGDNIHLGTFVTGFLAAVSSGIMNNHPTADMMAWVIQDFSLPTLQRNMLAFAALIGGDLGPKMLPIGSLAALMWFRILRDKGVIVPYSLYIKIGIPVTLLAVLLSIAVLQLEYAIYMMMS